MAATVSIILPTYNAADYLGPTIRSALDQTFTDFELLVLDNASTDDTPSLMATFTDPRIQYRRNATNLGMAGNVELGRSLVSAPYVVVFNADDIWTPTYLAKALTLLRSDKRLAFVHSSITLMDELGQCYGGAVTGWQSLTPGREAFLNCFLAGFSSPTVLMRSDVLRAVPPLPTTEPWGLVPDSWLFLQLCLRGDVEFVAEPLMRYRVHSTSMMSKSYVNGTFFRRRMATVRDAFAWPEVRAWASPQDQRRVLHHVARQATTILPVIRGAHSRGSFVRAFAEIVGKVPAVAMHPEPWARLAYGLLPRRVINALRAQKRKSWAARHAEPSLP